MKHVYTIKGDETLPIKIQGKPCACGASKGETIALNFTHLMGRVSWRDKGKRVYMSIGKDFNENVFQVENDEQYQKRTDSYIGCKEGHKPSVAGITIDPCDIPF